VVDYCQYCGAAMRFPFKSRCAFTQANKSLFNHETRCKDASDADRANFLKSKRWPLTDAQKELRNKTARRRKERNV